MRSNHVLQSEMCLVNVQQFHHISWICLKQEMIRFLELQSFQSGGFLFAEHFIGSHLHGMGLPGSHKSGGDLNCLCWEFRRVRFCVIQNLRGWGMWSSGLRRDCGIN